MGLDENGDDQPGREPDFSWRGVSAWVNKAESGKHYVNVSIELLDTSFPLFPNNEAAKTALEHVYEEGGD